MGETCSKSQSKRQKKRPALQPSCQEQVTASLDRNNDMTKAIEEFHTRNTIRSNNRNSTNRSSMSTFDSYAIKHVQEVLNAAYRGELDVVNAHIGLGFPVDFPLNQSGWTLSHIAAQTGNEIMLEFLIKYEPDFDVQEIGEGWTPLMVAAINNKEKIAEILVKNGADKWIKDNGGKTAVDLAEKYRSSGVCKVLNGSKV
ncbi:unnamed protein product [Blepharisma stoltei]|uniref:Uncharacterized protein n=1 Tax=Blepharisma stoltei TaxID=1481888 RepID=A0AAU9JBH4_9CILI|nr:unnamed protein product [Blepharisma stoltei]